MTATDDLPGALFDLASEIITEMHDKDIEKIEEPYIKRRFHTVPPDDLAGARIIRTTEERISKEGWNPETYDIILEEIGESNVFEECIEDIHSRVGETRREPENLMEDFVRTIIDLDVDDSSSREVMNTISLFLAHLDNSPILWHGTSWINGLEINESIRLEESVTIRPPTEDDLEIELPLPTARHQNNSIPTSPSSIIEFSNRTNEVTELDEERDIILSTLSLYNVVTIPEVRWNRESKSFNRGPRLFQNYSIDREKMDVIPYTYEIDSVETDDLREFYSEIRPLISGQIIQKQEDDFLTIAFERYQDAIADDDSAESRLTAAIMCLEALLLGDEGELSEKLSRRTGIILGFFEDYHPIEVRDRTKSAYNIRSQYVHGTKIGEGDNIEDLTASIMDYARRILITILQLRGEIGKKKLANKLDESALHDGPKQSLKEKIEDNCTI